MTHEDFETLQHLAPFVSSFKRIGIFSPTHEPKLFPKATRLSKWQWNLNKPGRKRFDLLIASNVFMYSPEPERWFRHVFACCKYFLLIDLVKRRRGFASEFGSDRDCMRYSIGDRHPRVAPFFDLNRFQDRLVGHQTYPGGANEFDQEPLHLSALFRGDLAVPILRIDDFPTGIRPILPNLKPLYDILARVDARGIAFHLGIVPALLNDEMIRTLRTLRHMIPVVHGFDHSYFKYAPQLEKQGDPYNQKNRMSFRGSFDEFADSPYAEILEKLIRGRELLQEKLEKHIEAYIPPCNRSNRKTGRALEEAGYLYYLSEKKISGCSLPCVKSDFYGRSSQYHFQNDHDVITLHLTWEWDQLRNGKPDSLNPLLDYLSQRKLGINRQETHLSAAFA